MIKFPALDPKHYVADLTLSLPKGTTTLPKAQGTDILNAVAIKYPWTFKLISFSGRSTCAVFVLESGEWQFKGRLACPLLDTTPGKAPCSIGGIVFVNTVSATFIASRRANLGEEGTYRYTYQPLHLVPRNFVSRDGSMRASQDEVVDMFVDLYNRKQEGK
jgi:hypothetical protein